MLTVLPVGPSLVRSESLVTLKLLLAVASSVSGLGCAPTKDEDEAPDDGRRLRGHCRRRARPVGLLPGMIHAVDTAQGLAPSPSRSGCRRASGPWACAPAVAAGGGRGPWFASNFASAIRDLGCTPGGPMSQRYRRVCVGSTWNRDSIVSGWFMEPLV